MWAESSASDIRLASCYVMDAVHFWPCQHRTDPDGVKVCDDA